MCHGHIGLMHDLLSRRLTLSSTGLVDSDMVIEYIYALNKVYPALEGRIKFTTDVEHQTANADHRVRSRQP